MMKQVDTLWYSARVRLNFGKHIIYFAFLVQRMLIQAGLNYILS